MSTKCRVCHRPLTNPAHSAAGIGPDCARRVAARQAANERAEKMAEKLVRIERGVRQAAKAMAWAEKYQAAALNSGTPEEREQGEWYVRLTTGWYGRWRMMQMRAQRMGVAQPSAFGWDQRPHGAQAIVREAW